MPCAILDEYTVDTHVPRTLPPAFVSCRAPLICGGATPPANRRPRHGETATINSPGPPLAGGPTAGFTHGGPKDYKFCSNLPLVSASLWAWFHTVRWAQYILLWHLGDFTGLPPQSIPPQSIPDTRTHARTHTRTHTRTLPPSLPPSLPHTPAHHMLHACLSFYKLQASLGPLLPSSTQTLHALLLAHKGPAG